MKVKVVKLGAAAQTANLPEGMTLGQAIDYLVNSLELTIDAQDFANSKVLVNGFAVDEDTVLKDGDTVTSTPPKIAGGN